MTTAFGVGAPLVALYFGVRVRYRRTLGRRRESYGRLARLGVGAQLSFFISVLGEPPAIRRTRDGERAEYVGPDDPRYDPAKDRREDGDVDAGHLVKVSTKYTECFFIDRDYYVQTVSDADETVLAFSITTRNLRFKPVFTGVPETSWPTRFSERIRFRSAIGARRWPRSLPSSGPRDRDQPYLFKVRLGHTRFSNVSGRDRPPLEAHGEYWPRGASYSEVHYFGNPGYYLNYVFTTSSSSGGAIGPMDFADPLGGFRWPPKDDSKSSAGWEELHDLQRFRRETVVMSYSVVGDLALEDYPTTYGPAGDEVRRLP